MTNVNEGASASLTDDKMDTTSTEESSETKSIGKTPVCLLVLGMAGSGKTEFVKRLSSYQYEQLKPYTINLDPACKETPYHAHIGNEIHGIKKIFSKFNLRSPFS